MADIAPKAEAQAFGDDFTAAKPDHSRPRCPLVLVFKHVFRIFGASTGISPPAPSCHSRADSEQFFAIRQEA
jgi:hypothetical protein